MHALHLNGLALFAWYVQITIIDLLPKLLVGQTSIWKSYTELFKNKDLINQYRQRLNALVNGHNSNRTIFNVVDELRRSVNGKSLTRFKP
ncbi:hypothetical protein [Mucilaginibacter humi]|uniref:hypothetical protein n=1 Tax=Mucilaginibacter humi TaxID=2732510 RepID=UPI001C2E779E|nr:hypothetical protein [Mucilaginibacter humi]